MKIIKQEIKFRASGSPDVGNYAVVIGPAGLGFVRDLDGNILDSNGGNVLREQLPSNTPDSQGFITADLSQFDSFRMLDGVYDIGLIVVDDVGNESSTFTLSNEPLDFTVPDAITEAFMIRS